MQRLSRQRILGIAALVLVIVVVLFAWGQYDRPAHHYDASFEPCWGAAALAALGAPSAFAPTFCSSPPGNLAGIGPLLTTRRYIASSGYDIVIFTTARSTNRGVEGLAYVVRGTPASDSCAFHLGGPWWQLVFKNSSSRSCPRGFTFQPET